jgi:DNA-binding response OmpR family regulator
MMVPTVLMVGESRLALIPEYLSLGSIVVIAPDRETLRRWQEEQHPPGSATAELEPSGAVVDMDGRRILWQGDSLPLSQLEFRALSALLASPGRALSFRDLRQSGWGDGPELPVDPYTVKALVQRLRAKISAVSAPISIESVPGFGFRAAVDRSSRRTGLAIGVPEGKPWSVSSGR